MRKLIFTLLLLLTLTAQGAAQALQHIQDSATPTLSPTASDTRFPTATITDTPTATRTRGPAPTDTLVVVLTVTRLDDGTLFHIVQKGETLWSIALAYGMKEEEIVRLNQLGDKPVIYENQKLKLRVAFTPTATEPTSTFTPAPTITRYPTATSSPTLSPTPQPVSASSRENGLFAIGIIAGAAALLALILGGGKRKKLEE